MGAAGLLGGAYAVCTAAIRFAEATNAGMSWRLSMSDACLARIREVSRRARVGTVAGVFVARTGAGGRSLRPDGYLIKVHTVIFIASICDGTCA